MHAPAENRWWTTARTAPPKRCARGALKAGLATALALVASWGLAQPANAQNAAQSAVQATAPTSMPAAAAGRAADLAAVPVEAFFGRADMTQPLLSPSGRHLAFLRVLPSGRNALLTLDLHNPQSLQALATFSDADIAGVHWAGEEQLLFSLTDNLADRGGRDAAPGLFSVGRSDGQPPRVLILTQHLPAIRYSTGGVERRLDPNHRLLFVPQDNSGEVVIGQLHQGATDLISLELLRLNLQTQRTRRLDFGAPGNVNRWWFDTAGEPRVAEVLASGRVQVHWREPGSSTWREILNVDRLFAPWSPFAVDAAGTLYVTHAQGREGLRVLSRFDFAKNAPAATPSVEVPGFDFRGGLVAEQTSGRTLGVRALTDGETTVWSDPGMKALQAHIDNILPDRVNRLTCRNCASEARTVLVQSWSNLDPGTHYLWQGDKQRLVRLGRARPGVDPARMAHLDFKRIKARDGRPLPMWLTLPRRADGAPPPPVVVLVHGGPWVRGVVWGWHALPQFLASRGYAVVEPEFRGSAGYGQAHEQAGWKQWGQAMQDDIADALLWAADQGHVDGTRACIGGTSYGGYAALMGLVRHPTLYRCGIAAAAVTDLMRVVEGGWWWRDDVSEESRRYNIPATVGEATADADMLRQNSPVLQATRIKAPVLLVHGARDLRVPLVHATDMQKALRAAGNEPEWLLFDDEAHGWRKPENQQRYARELEAFLARHLLAGPALQRQP